MEPQPRTSRGTDAGVDVAVKLLDRSKTEEDMNQNLLGKRSDFHFKNRA
jgi:hypothetical protein